MTFQGNTEAPKSGEVTPAKMDAALKAKWVEALRSGEYQQTRGRLKDDTGYCCLGVLCEVAGLEINEEGLGVRTEGRKCNYGPIFDLIGGRNASQPCIMRNDGSDSSHLHRHSFTEIADYIEQHL